VSSRTAASPWFADPSHRHPNRQDGWHDGKKGKTEETMISGIESGEIGELGEIGGLLPPTLLQSAPLTPRVLAHAVDHHVAALWRGEKNIDDDFFVWLTSLWSPTAAPEPNGEPIAVSVLGAGGVGIRWYDAGSAFVGYVPGRPGGCYRVPTTAVLPQAGREPARSRVAR
jgi:hypothetical protein